MIIRVAEGEHQGKNIWINIRHPACAVDYMIETDSGQALCGFGGKEILVTWKWDYMRSAIDKATEEVRTFKIGPLEKE